VTTPVVRLAAGTPTATAMVRAAVEGRPLDGRLADGDADALIDALAPGRLLGPAADSLGAGHLLVGPAPSARLLQLHRQAMVVCLAVDRAVCRAVDVLDSDDIDHRVLKGVATAQLDHRRPELRQYGDGDLLVATDRFANAARALEAGGFRRLVPELRPGIDRRFGKSITFADEHGFQIDLHRSLSTGAFSSRTSFTVLPDAEELDICGVRLRALPRPARLVHTAAHLLLRSGSAHLSTLQDLVAQTELLDDPDTARRVAADWGLETVLAEALAAATEVGLELPGRWRSPDDSLSASSPARRELEEHRRAGGFGDRAGAQLAALSPVDRLVVGAALAWPSRLHLRARGLTRRGHLRRLVGRVRVRRPGRPA
jgi:hypothetical protein